MRIGIEAQRIFRPHKHGMDRVAIELIRNLQQLDHENQYYIFVKPDEDTGVLREKSNFKIVEIPEASYPVWEQLRLPKMVAKYNCDLLHCTSNTAPVSGDTPLVTTLHDIIYLEQNPLKQLLSSSTPYQKFGNFYRRTIVPRVTRRSKQLITVSEFEKANISRRFGAGVAGKLKAVHNGVSEHFKPVSDRDSLNAIRLKYQLPEKYLLFFGSKDPRKNSARVVQAFARYNQRNPDSYLVLMGYGNDDLNQLLQELDLSDLRDKIVLPGYVADKDLPGIYQGAELFLFPSLREGFGIPIIEAMACGTPVITSNTSSMPEVAGEAACLVDPYKVSAIIEGIERVLGDKRYRDEIVDKGFNQKDKFSWRAMAQKVLQVYDQVYNDIQA